MNNDKIFLTPQQIMEMPMGQRLVFDIEIFRNFFFFAAKVAGTNYYIVFDADENKPIDINGLRYLISRHTFVGFNSANFDIPILTYALTGASVKEIKEVCDKIILDRVSRWDFYEEFQLKKLIITHVDLIEVCPLKGPLELYGARLHAKSIIPMPSRPDKFLTQEEKIDVGNYCLKDLDVTELIMNNLGEQLQLRADMSAQYEVDLMSSSDAQIAEKVMRHELRKLLGKSVKAPHFAPGYAFEYDPPQWVEFYSESLQTLFDDICDSDFTVSESGHPELPDALEDRTVTIGQSTYKIGIGGLHSTESCQAVVPAEGGYLLDIDVASYYPTIVLHNKFAPDQLGDSFLQVYQTLVDRRLSAKAAGQKAIADSLKIVINGMYGKFGDKWSCVYNPKNVIQVTLTGQLALLMLIEVVELQGIQVVSANTDGIVFNIKNDQELEQLRAIVKAWGNHTGFDTEETFYKGLWSRDVNSYIALKEGGKTKTKGAYLIPEGIFRFHKNPDCIIVNKALCAYVSEGTPVRETITNCKNIEDFLVVRQVKGGAEYVGEPIGKVVRWYYSRHSNAHINILKSGNKVAKSEGSKPLQVLPETLPDDLDFEAYVRMAEEGLYLIGAKQRFERQTQIFTKEELASLY